MNRNSFVRNYYNHPIKIMSKLFDFGLANVGGEGYINRPLPKPVPRKSLNLVTLKLRDET